MLNLLLTETKFTNNKANFRLQQKESYLPTILL